MRKLLSVVIGCFLPVVMLLSTGAVNAFADDPGEAKDTTEAQVRPVLPRASAVKDTTYFDIGGALRFNAFYKTWEGQQDNRNKGGDLAFDTWRINVDGRKGGLFISAEYRFYAGYNMLHHGYLGYDFSPETQLQIGVNQVPFGNLKYNSHSWFFTMPYYVGLEDDYDAGVKLTHNASSWNFALAFYKNSEGSFTGSSDLSARYSYDVVGKHEEVNQFNGRIAYNFGQTEIGASGQYGQLYNREPNSMGDHYAFAAHMNSNFSKFNLKAQSIYFNHNPSGVSGRENDVITMGAYDFPYEVAAKGFMHTFCLAYDVEVDWGPVSKLTFYDNFTYFDKAAERFNDSQMNSLGMMVTAGPVYTYFDIASGNNHPWIGPVWSQALADPPDVDEGDRQKSWSTRFNINIGYYF